MMSKVGTFLAPSDITHAMQVLVADQNFAALDAVTDYLTSNQKSYMDPNTLGDILIEAARYTTFGSGTSTDAQTATVVRDLMVKLGANMPPADITTAMQIFAADQNFAALDAVTDYLTSNQKSYMDPAVLGDVLIEVARYTSFGSGTSTNAQTATVVRDLMVKLGANMPPADITTAMLFFAADQNFAALDAVTDYLTPNQKSYMDPAVLGDVLIEVARYTTFGSGTSTDAQTASVVRDLMVKFGANMPPADITTAMLFFAADQNFAALDAVTDYLTPNQKSYMDPAVLGDVLIELARYTSFGSGTTTDAQTATSVRDLMVKLGSNIPASDIADAVEILLADKNWGALDAIFDNLSDYAISAVVSEAQAALTANSVKVLLNGNDTFTGTSANETVYAVGGNDIINVGSGSDKVYAGTGNDQVRGGSGSDLLYGEEGDDRLWGDDGNDSLYGQDGLDTLWGGVGNDTLSGGNQADTLYGEVGDDILNGGGDNDTLVGGDGNDVLNGGSYTDILTGGLGRDTFVFQDTATGFDVITDFSVSQGDILDFSALLDGFDPVTMAITDFITKTVVSGDTVISIDADGSGSGAAVQVAVLDNLSNFNIQTMYDNGQIIT